MIPSVRLGLLRTSPSTYSTSLLAVLFGQLLSTSSHSQTAPRRVGLGQLFVCLQIAIQRRQVHQPGIVGFGLGMGGISEADASEEGIIDVPPFTTFG